jgi:CHAD domain-containing protein
MSVFRVRPRKPVAQELARVMERQIHRARVHLDAWSADSELAFHDVRRRLKKVRAAARVAREVDELLARAINASARDAARVLSGVRDADVVHAAAERLAREVEDDEAAYALEKFAADAARSAPSEDQRDALAAHAASVLEVTSATAHRLRDGDAPRRILRRAAARVVRRAERAFLAAHAGPEGVAIADENVRHEWRKRVKDLWYVGRLLRPVWTLAERPDDALASELGKILGEERDLLLLAARLRGAARSCGGADPRNAALAAVEAERARLIAAARRLGRKVHGLELPSATHAREDA